MRPILFPCPITGLNVQHLLTAVPEDEKDCYQSVLCPACARMHLVHNTTGRLLGESRTDQARQVAEEYAEEQRKIIENLRKNLN